MARPGLEALAWRRPQTARDRLPDLPELALEELLFGERASPVAFSENVPAGSDSR